MKNKKTIANCPECETLLKEGEVYDCDIWYCEGCNWRKIRWKKVNLSSQPFRKTEQLDIFSSLTGGVAEQ